MQEAQISSITLICSIICLATIDLEVLSEN